MEKFANAYIYWLTCQFAGDKKSPKRITIKHKAYMNTHSRIQVCGAKMFYFGYFIFEPHGEKTGFLPIQKQRRRSASQ